MAAAIATLKASLDVQPALSASGLPTGLDLSQSQSAVSYAINVQERRAFSFTLANPGNAQAVSFGGITSALLLLIIASAPVQIDVTITNGGASHTTDQVFVAALNASSSGLITAVNITAITAGTTVDVMVAG